MGDREDLLKIEDPHRRLRALVAYATYQSLVGDVKPPSTAGAVFAVRQKSGKSPTAFAAVVLSSNTVIAHIEAGGSRGTPTLLRRVAAAAIEYGLTNTSEYLRLQADLLEAEIRKKGGRR